ncbi:thiosulfate sulfurtransferase GlpE [Aliidiomarina taiwanensis]|uniref:Thiosulfate sulfurtransferase GlpE n=1 Tax=Aliidiomarina taiwanensis TaxID=946228 RepID=A0A432X7A3_9GAMM|nr:thiosulfate sulfurtransferase GlpE [Aliidiomarina taiwanensis]RUO42720.1 thiosulfate sulfurtransferase GlpE [Aliidiomarina taiwanensis]
MKEFQNITLADAKLQLDEGSLAVADIRDPQNFAKSHLKGAINLNNDNIGEFIQENTGKPVLVVCYHGVSSQKAAQYMLEQGIGEAYSLTGGMAAWLEAYPNDHLESA